MRCVIYARYSSDNREEISVDGFDKAKRYIAQELADRNYNIDLCGFPHEEEEILPPYELIEQYQEKRASLNADIDRILAKIEAVLGNRPLATGELEDIHGK